MSLSQRWKVIHYDFAVLRASRHGRSCTALGLAPWAVLTVLHRAWRRAVDGLVPWTAWRRGRLGAFNILRERCCTVLGLALWTALRRGRLGAVGDLARSTPFCCVCPPGNAKTRRLRPHDSSPKIKSSREMQSFDIRSSPQRFPILLILRDMHYSHEHYNIMKKSLPCVMVWNHYLSKLVQRVVRWPFQLWPKNGLRPRAAVAGGVPRP